MSFQPNSSMSFSFLTTRNWDRKTEWIFALIDDIYIFLSFIIPAMPWKLYVTMKRKTLILRMKHEDNLLSW
jgi:hypothetical protein